MSGDCIQGVAERGWCNWVWGREAGEGTAHGVRELCMLSYRDLVTEACMPSHPARLLSSLAPQAKLKELVASVASSKILHNKREIDVKRLGGRRPDARCESSGRGSLQATSRSAHARNRSHEWLEADASRGLDPGRFERTALRGAAQTPSSCAGFEDECTDLLGRMYSSDCGRNFSRRREES